MRHLATCILAASASACAAPRTPGTDAPGSTLPASLPSVSEGAVESPAADVEPAPGSFGDDLRFLQKHTKISLLQSEDGQSQVAVASEYQGRVMTSTASGASGVSFGWIHRSVIERHAPQPHMTTLGGEDRFWLGPEGGQYGLYFPPGAPFEFQHWQVPEAIDWGAWSVTSETEREVGFEKTMDLQNHSGSRFTISATRSVRLLDAETLTRHLGATPGPGTRVVGYESDNAITNAGAVPWKRASGLVSIWILGMFTPSAETTVILPIQPGDEKKLGPAVNDHYFGRVPEDRLQVDNDVVFFRADGQARGKIGIPPARARPVAGSYDAARGVLTIVQYTLPSTPGEYVNSQWARQKNPYTGDVVNSYNDGPAEPGAAPMGPFYELESSSPAAALAPGQSVRHVHRTIHLEGPESELDVVARAQLGIGLAAVRQVFAKRAE